MLNRQRFVIIGAGTGSQSIAAVALGGMRVAQDILI